MLWMALRLPYLALDALLRGHTSPELRAIPVAVGEERHVLACNDAAAVLGVRAGMKLSSAAALAPSLRVHARDPGAEATALEGMAAWVCQFTPVVSLEPRQGLLAEVSGSLRLFGGLNSLAGHVREGAQAMGLRAQVAAAPTARGAWWFAVSGREILITGQDALVAALGELPIGAIQADTETEMLLEHLGITTIGKLLQLPRAGLSRRCGQALLSALDRAVGNSADPRPLFSLPPQFDARLELPGTVEHAEGVLFAARRLLVQLEGLLAARQSGIRAFRLTLVHECAQTTTVEVNLASAGSEAARFIDLLRERLAGVLIPDPVEAIRIEAGDFVPLHAGSQDLFGDARTKDEDWARLFERLRARLGESSVYAPGLHSDHRPERAWQALSPDRYSGVAAAPCTGPRPFWLLYQPRRLPEREGAPWDGGALELLAGPERIESGWWDGEEAVRDYFIARTSSCALLWIFRAYGGDAGGWYVHGIFS